MIDILQKNQQKLKIPFMFFNSFSTYGFTGYQIQGLLYDGVSINTDTEAVQQGNILFQYTENHHHLTIERDANGVPTKVEWTKKNQPETIVPATGLSKEATELTKKIAVKAHELAGCSGVSRVDFMIKEDKPYFLEVNTSPGMTDTSDLPAQAAVCGIDYDNLVLMILKSAGLDK